MGDSHDLIKKIIHYQQCLEKYTKRENESRMLYCISKLYQMPITVKHLEETGVGRTVNSLRKFSGEVGEAAKSLVAKWKEMVVVEDNEAKEVSNRAESGNSHKEESKDRKHKEKSSSSHRDSDKKSKHESKEKRNSSSSSKEEQSTKKEKPKHHEQTHRKEKDHKHSKHKSSKRKYSSDDDSDSDDDSRHKKLKSNYEKHKTSKQKIEEDSDEEDDRYEREMRKKSSHKHKSSKRRHEDSSDDDDDDSEDESEKEYEELNVKHRKYSEKSDSDTEEKRVKPLQHHSRHKSGSDNDVKEKSRSHTHKDKKEKREPTAEDKSKKHDKHSTKEKPKTSSEKKQKEDDDKKSKHSSSTHNNKEQKSKSKKSSSTVSVNRAPIGENGIGSGSGTSFAEALGMLVPTKSKSTKKKVAVIHPLPVAKEKVTYAVSSPEILNDEVMPVPDKKLEPLDINVASLLPEITPNYRPVKSFPLDNGQPKPKITTEDEALSAIMYSKISRTKVYSGNKVIWGKVPTLFDLCTRVLQDNIDALEYTGGVPYNILKPVVERANPMQLYTLEHHNPYLMDDTDELWELHCQKEFRNKKREEMETWREVYMRCMDEREAKLKALTANIKQSQDKSLPVRQTKLAYVDHPSIVKPPRSVARKQAKHGTKGSVEKKPLVTPSSRITALATAGAAGLIAVPNPGARAASASGNSSTVVKPKKAPLMQKTLAFMKNRLYRR